MKILDRYIRYTIYLSTAFVVLVLLGIQSFLQLVEEFHHIGQHHYGLLKALLFVPMQLPAQFYQLFPMAGFLGCLIGLGRMAASSQLIVMRASGVSIARITGSVLKAAIPMIVVVTVLGEGLGPKWLQQSFSMRAHALNSAGEKSPSAIWIREGDTYTRVGNMASSNLIEDITRYHFDENSQLTKATFAKFGKLQPNGQWMLFDLYHTLFFKDHTQVIQQKEEAVNLLLRPNLQVQIEMGATEQAIISLYHAIGYQQSIGLTANQLIYSFVQRIIQPLTTLIMIGLGVPFVFGSLRGSAMGLKVLMGVVMGFAFYMLNQLFGPITLVYQYPPVLAAITPTVIFAMILVFLLVKTRFG